jgi:hypothetical protein
MIVAALAVVVFSLPADRAEAAAFLEKTLPVNPADLPGGQLDAALDLARSAGVTQVQSSATWWWLTRHGPRSYDWSDLDRLVAAARSRGMDVVLQLNGTPDWVHPKLVAQVPDHMERVWYPPVHGKRELSHWARFVARVVRRYRGKVAQYEVWNEPNHDPFWNPAPNVTQYARLLKTAYDAARDADPHAKIVFAGLAQNAVGYLTAFYDAVDRMWPRRGRQSDYFFNILGAHP